MHHKAKTFMTNAITFKEFDKCSYKETTNGIFYSFCLNYEGSKQV